MQLIIQPNIYSRTSGLKNHKNISSNKTYTANGLIGNQVSFKGDSFDYKKNEMGDQASNKGWNRVAGNELLKERFNQSFIRKLAAEQDGINVKMPNGILFYGLPSTGKTAFAKALTEQSGCNIQEIDMMKPKHEIISDLLKAGHKSLENYKQSGNERKRTIILLDEFDTAIREDDSFEPKMKNFLQKCSDEYKCTVLMTTSHPLNIDSELLAEQRVPLKIFLGPPEKEDAAAIFKFYLKGATDQAIDHNKLADEVLKARKTNYAFSVGRIKNVVEICADSATKLGHKITEDGLLKVIRGIGPDISPAKMEKFAREIAEMSKRVM